MIAHIQANTLYNVAALSQCSRYIFSMTTPHISPSQIPGAPLLRRLMAIVYDLLLLLAVLFVTTALAIVMNHGEAINDHPYYIFFVFFQLLISFIYYGWFWTHGGQTLGMKTWKMKLTTRSGGQLNWQQALVYFVAAMISWSALGLGYLWALFNHSRATWHDLIAQCMMRDTRKD